MKILALEFSTLRRSAAILEIVPGHARVLASHTQEPERHGSPFPLIELLFREINRNEIEGIAVGLGPGSYTGIRSSLAIAQGWNLSRNVLAVGISSADAIACEALHEGIKGPIEVVIDAQRGEVYSAGYHLTSLGDAGFHRISESGEDPEPSQFGIFHTRTLAIVKQPYNESRLVGPEANRWNPNALVISPGAIAIGMLAAKQSFGPVEALEPIYLRETSFVKAPAISRV